MKVLIAGCGDVGSTLGRLLVAQSHTVWGLCRNINALPSEIQPLAADLLDVQSLDHLPAGIEVLYYTAAASGFNDAAYRAVYVDGLRYLLAALDNSSLQRVIYVSSTGVYAQTDAGWVDETSTTQPPGFSGQRLLEGEAMAMTPNVSAVAVRFAGIYGPGRERLLNQVRGGASCCESPPQWTNRIHRDDCAGVLAHLLRIEAPEPVYIGVDHEPAPMCEVMDWLASQLHAPTPVRSLSQSPAQGSNKRCSNRLLLASGYQFKYENYRQGYTAQISATGTQ